MPEIKTRVSSRLYYLKLGAGPALVLLHGFPESCSLWRNVWDDLAQNYTVIMPDFPGSGESILEQETSIDDMAECVLAIIDAEGIEKAVIAGHSMGGYAAFAFAARYPQRLAGLSLVHSTPVADDEEKKNARKKAIALIENGGKNAFIRQMVPKLFSEGFKQLHPQLIEEQTELGLELDEQSLINFYKAMMSRDDQSELLTNAEFPVQWIIGMDDNIIYYKKILAQCAKSGINFVTFYYECGHMSMLEAPEKLISDLSLFADYCFRRQNTSL